MYNENIVFFFLFYFIGSDIGIQICNVALHTRIPAQLHLGNTARVPAYRIRSIVHSPTPHIRAYFARNARFMENQGRCHITIINCRQIARRRVPCAIPTQTNETKFNFVCRRWKQWCQWWTRPNGCRRHRSHHAAGTSKRKRCWWPNDWPCSSHTQTIQKCGWW